MEVLCVFWRYFYHTINKSSSADVEIRRTKIIKFKCEDEKEMNMMSSFSQASWCKRKRRHFDLRAIRKIERKRITLFVERDERCIPGLKKHHIQSVIIAPWRWEKVEEMRGKWLWEVKSGHSFFSANLKLCWQQKLKPFVRSLNQFRGTRWYEMSQ